MPRGLMTSIDSLPNATSHGTGAYRRLLFASACAALATVAGASGASAQMVGFMPDVYVDIDEPEPRIEPRGVMRRLQNRGFVEIGRPRFDGRAYVVDATHPSGSRVRLFVDAYDGALLGRRVIGQAYLSPANPPQARVARAAPGYGWAEDEPALRRGPREFDGPIPPGEIPMPGGRRRNAALGTEPPGAPDAYGINPEGKARSGPATRKNARVTQPQKSAQPQAVPPAPEPRLDSPQAAKPKDDAEQRDARTPVDAKTPADARPIEARRDAESEGGAEATKADAAKADAAPSEAAMADGPVAGGSKGDYPPGASESRTTGAAGPAQVTPAANRSDAASKDASETPREQAWKDIEPSKKNVRVIDGATVVPGSEPTPPSTN